MKANKIFAVALAALTLVGFNACKKSNGGEDVDNVTLTFSKTVYTVAPNQTIDLAAELTVKPAGTAVAWSSNKTEIATISEAGVATGVSVGTVIITAKAGSVSKSVTLKVEGEKQADAIETAVRIWPLLLDNQTTAAYESKIVANFGPNDVDRHLYDWNQNTEEVQATGKNYYGNLEGYYSAKLINEQWNGLGFAVTDKTPVQTMINAMKANPEKFFLHIAIKSTQNYSYWFNLFDTDHFWFTLGNKALQNGDPAHNNPLFGEDFTRDGSWAVYNIPMSQFAAYFDNYAQGDNVLAFGTEPVAGNIINLDAIFFYEIQ